MNNKTINTNITDPIDPDEHDPCIACAGYGVVNEEECWICEGTGKET